MSLVLGWTDGIIGYIASDGRAGGDEPSENYNKTRKVNENIILGFVGMKSQAEYFLNCVYESLGDDVKNCYIEDFMEPLEYGISLPVTKEKLRSTFLIIGKSKSKEIKYILVGNATNYLVKYLDPFQKRLFPIGGTIEKDKILDICEKHSLLFKGNVKETMKNIIYEVSDIDNSINKNVYYQEITS